MPASEPDYESVRGYQEGDRGCDPFVVQGLLVCQLKISELLGRHLRRGHVMGVLLGMWVLISASGSRSRALLASWMGKVVLGCAVLSVFVVALSQELIVCVPVIRLELLCFPLFEFSSHLFIRILLACFFFRRLFFLPVHFKEVVLA